MTQAKLVIRFDIDTVVCIRSGVPALLRFADRHDVRFSFFANMGRAIDYGTVFRRRGRGRGNNKAARLSARRKLGLPGLITTVLLNPRVGAGSVGILKAAVSAGHDVGLHGGANHGSWQHLSPQWQTDRLDRELDWGIDAMVRNGLPRPRLFSSPGWTTPPALRNALRDREFVALADLHTDGAHAQPVRKNGLVEVATGMVAEPGGVGFIENLLARNLSAAERGAVFDSYFEKQVPLMAYDHPALAGREGLPLLEELIVAARRHSYAVITFSELIGID